MIAILRQEIRKVTARRGSFWSAVGITLALALTIVVISVIVYQVRDDPTGGAEALDLYKGLLFVPLVAFVLVTSQAGAWDFANGTFRYLAVTGRSKQQLLALTAAGVILTSLAVTAPYCAIGIAQAFAFPLSDPVAGSLDLSGTEAATAKDVVSFLWFAFAQVTFWSILALAVGALMRSSGAGIAVAMVLYFGGFTFGGLLGIWNDTLRQVLPNFAITRVAGAGDDSLGLALVMTAAWLALFAGAALLRTARSEY
jgi:hypothetical protein